MVTAKLRCDFYKNPVQIDENGLIFAKFCRFEAKNMVL